MSFIIDVFHRFWKQHPAMLYGLALLLGFSSSLNWNWGLLAPITVLAGPLLYSAFCRQADLCIRMVLAILLLFGAFGFAKVYYQFPTLPIDGVLGRADLEIISVSSKSTSFGKLWSYRGTLEAFEPASTSQMMKAKHLPIAISLPQNGEITRPHANQAYQIKGVLKETAPGYYTLIVPKDTPWYPIEGSWSFAEMRFLAKQKVSQYIHSHITGVRTATFLSGIATGDFDDRLMSFEFSRFGLQHIMAISGFHFAIIASILSILLRLMFNKRRGTLLLIFLLSSYFVFLGCGPSIMRAWITILIALLSFIVEKQGSGINSLGVALIAVLLMDPLLCRHMGFQFSFITTAAILLFFPGCDLAMQSLFAKRPLSQMIEMNGINQHGYCVLVFFRQALALTFAVNLIALPIMLFYFQKFPLLSLIYNLFFPFLVSISMLLLLLGLLFSLGIPLLGSAIHLLNSHYTQFVLNFTYNMPTTLDVTWRVSPFSLELLLLYLTVVFVVAIFLRNALEQRQLELQDLSLI